jgi:ACT domain
MSFLLRVELPDVPGSLGRLASAIGEAGGDIEAIEIIEKSGDGTAVDDVLLELVGGTMPDSIVSACTELEGVRVLWISRYAAGGNVFLDLEAVEDLTAHPEHAMDRLVDLLPAVFRSDWGARVSSDGRVRHRTDAAPDHVSWADLAGTARLHSDDDVTLLCATRVDEEEIVVLGRHGGPEFLDSELARLGHLTQLARSIHRTPKVTAEVVEPA